MTGHIFTTAVGSGSVTIAMGRKMSLDVDIGELIYSLSSNPSHFNGD